MNTNEPPPTESAFNPRDNPFLRHGFHSRHFERGGRRRQDYQLPYAQLLYAEMISNPALEKKPDAPPEKLLIRFALADVVVLGSGLKAVERAFQNMN